MFPLLPPNEQSRAWYYGAGAMRYFIARDANKDPRDITPTAYKEQSQKISALMDSTNPDLSAFLARGGKLILKENLSDFAQSLTFPRATQSAVKERDRAATASGRIRLLLETFTES